MIIRFDEPGSDDKARVGGKGVNLGLCAQEGFPVPPGFTVTTDAYAAFLMETGVDRLIIETLRGADPRDTAELESRTTTIRDGISSTHVPPGLATTIGEAYVALGEDQYVAVRSSGTAEDLAEASFAGMHDTLLNVRGVDAVLDAVRSCWASLWTARAAAYRHENGLDDITQISMGVVVQLMVEPDVSGVMFTANPVSTATDEVVINASWGLGEAVVQGFVTPDEYVVKAHRPLAVGIEVRLTPRDAKPTLQVKARQVGAKEQRVIRDPETGEGTVTQEVPEAGRTVLTLTDAQAIELADLGRRVQAFYDELPQDIEWALLDGDFFLLQARPITGVDFDWAADIESFAWAPDDENTLWTSQWSLLVTGAKSPLYYQWICTADSVGYYAAGNALGIPELTGPSFYTNNDGDVNRPARQRVHKYYRCELYHNTELEKALAQRMSLPQLRSPEISPLLPPHYVEEVKAHPFSYGDFLRSFAQLSLVAPDARPFKVLDRVQQFIDVDTAGEVSDLTCLPDFDTLSDAALKRAIDEQWFVSPKYVGYSTPLYLVYWPQIMALFGRMIQAWYKGNKPNVFAELCQGASTRSKTLEENLQLYDLAEEIRGSEELSALFAEHDGGAFFAALETSETGRAFLERYETFRREHGHRGHEDRCFGYPRRWEDPAVDYRNFRMLLARDNPESPYELEEKLNRQREEAFADVMRHVRRSPLSGRLKAEAIRVVYEWVHRFNALRDDERWAYERSSMCAKLLCREIGRRCTERGLIEDQEDFVMFTKDELFDLLDGRMGATLARAKATARRSDYNRSLERTHEYPTFLRDGREVSLGTDAADDGLTGTGWTSGSVTATARVVNRLTEIDQVRQGDILVCQSTDPGWTPVFMLLSGIVVETGGVLSHAVCLSREYGLPAVQLSGARKRIPDGATVTLNGGTGEIAVLD